MILFLTACGNGGGTATQQGAPNSATLSWVPPTTNVDETPLTDLAGYKIYYGTSSGNYTEVVDTNDSLSTEYTLGNLAPGTYYFAATAYDTFGNESDYSNEVSKTIN